MRSPYIRTKSGRKFYFLDPEWYVPDIANHLAGLNRYTGAGYSVAQHEVVGAWMAERFYKEHPRLPQKFMIHDIAEAYVGDMSSPLKSLCPDYRAVIADLERDCERWSGVLFLDDPKVKELDTRMWLTERLVVFREAIEAGLDISEDVSWCELEPFPLDREELNLLFQPWDRKATERIWRTEFNRLLPHMEGR